MEVAGIADSDVPVREPALPEQFRERIEAAEQTSGRTPSLTGRTGAMMVVDVEGGEIDVTLHEA